MARRESRRTQAETNAVGNAHTRVAEADEGDDADDDGTDEDDDEGDESADDNDETGVRKRGESTSIDLRLNGDGSCSALSSM